MKTLPAIPVLLVSSLCLSSPTEAAWQRMGGPAGGSITTLQVRGNHVVADNWNDNHKSVSRDCGATWSDVMSRSPEESRAGGSDTIYTAAWDGVLSSFDSGVHWSRVPMTGLHDSQYTAHAVSKRGLYFGTPSGIVVTRDHGTTWEQANEGMDDKWANSIIAYGDTVLAGTNSGVYRSIDGGAHWVLSTTGITNTLFTGFAKGRGSVFVGTDDGSFRSKDGGITWEFFGPQDVMVRSLHSITVIGDSIYATTQYGGVYVSGLDVGRWRIFREGIANSLAKCGDRFIAGTRDGIALSSDNGRSWKRSNEGLPLVDAYSLAATDDVVLLGTSIDGIFQNADQGNEWSWVSSPFDYGNDHLFQVAESVIYGQIGNGLYKRSSTNLEWTYVPNSQIRPRATSFAVDGDTLLLGSDSGHVFLSVNSGATWIPRDSGLPRGRIIALHAHDGEIFAGVWDSGVYWWRKGASRWTKLVTAFCKDTYARAFVVTGKSLFALNHGTLYRFVRNGDTWSCPTSFPDHMFSAFIGSDSVLYGGGKGGVFASFDEAKTWTNVGSVFKPTPLTDPMEPWVISLASNSTTLYAGAYGDGIWKRPLSELTEASVQARGARVRGEPLRISWRSSSARRMVFDLVLDSPQEVGATIHDAQGRLVGRLWNGPLEAGVNTMDWDARSVESGTYLMHWTTRTSGGAIRFHVMH